MPFLAFLPNEDCGPGQDAGYQPPCGAEDEEEEEDPREKGEDECFEHGECFGPPTAGSIFGRDNLRYFGRNKNTHNIA